MWSQKMQQTSEYNKKETETHIENKQVVTSGERERGGAKEVQGIKRYKLLGIK